MDVVPSIYQFALIAITAFSIWRLLAEDKILERPRRWLVRLPQTWDDGDAIPRSYRDEWAIFLTCPWCLGAWVSLFVYIGWMFTLGDYPSSISEVLVAIGIWFALRASVGIIRGQLDPPEDA